MTGHLLFLCQQIQQLRSSENFCGRHRLTFNLNSFRMHSSNFLCFSRNIPLCGKKSLCFYISFAYLVEHPLNVKDLVPGQKVRGSYDFAVDRLKDNGQLTIAKRLFKFLLIDTFLQKNTKDLYSQNYLLFYCSLLQLYNN